MRNWSKIKQNWYSLFKNEWLTPSFELRPRIICVPNENENYWKMQDLSCKYIKTTRNYTYPFQSNLKKWSGTVLTHGSGSRFESGCVLHLANLFSKKICVQQNCLLPCYLYGIFYSKSQQLITVRQWILLGRNHKKSSFNKIGVIKIPAHSIRRDFNKT